MLNRGLDVDDVRAALRSSETIEEHDDASRPVLGRSGLRALHLIGPSGAPSGSQGRRAGGRLRGHGVRTRSGSVGRLAEALDRSVSCLLCRHGALQPGTADETLSFEGIALVVKGAPALICDTCGEPHFDEPVTQRLLDLARGAAAHGVVVDVRRYVVAA